MSETGVIPHKPTCSCCPPHVNFWQFHFSNCLAQESPCLFHAPFALVYQQILASFTSKCIMDLTTSHHCHCHHTDPTHHHLSPRAQCDGLLTLVSLILSFVHRGQFLTQRPDWSINCKSHQVISLLEALSASGFPADSE